MCRGVEVDHFVVVEPKGKCFVILMEKDGSGQASGIEKHAL